MRPVGAIYARWGHWFWLAVAALVVVLAIAAGYGGERWIALGIVGVVAFLAVLYALTRFVMWASRR